ncbi:LssY C-terminal domain-containing protein [Celerinatantimonas sp. YJH-8]|uniref:LssY C-terminal domain-containing protein n=1 Tax=Celerinatantimonas sp. YJH-8 TaxID=3228714 RepID=UPI0038C63E93
MDHITQIILTLVRDMGMMGYWVAFVAALAETLFVIGLLLPGSTFLLLMGVFAGQGVLDLGDLLCFAIAGAALGDNINYRLGRKYGHQWLKQPRWFLKVDYLSRAEVFFEHHGGKSVFLGRFVPSVKELMPFIAGMANMNRGSFLLWNLLGAIGWALQWILPGYIFSQSLALAHTWLSRIGMMLVALIALLLLLYLLRWAVIRFGAGSAQLAWSVCQSVGQAIADNSEVITWNKRHPRLSSFFKQRIDTSQIKGLPLTLIGVAMGYVVLLFGGLVEDLLEKEAIVATDLRVDALIASFRTPFLNHVFYAITTLGSPPVIVLGMGLMACLFGRMRQTQFILPMCLAAGLANVLTTIGKFAFHRVRPDVALITPGGYAFPSGHATVSIAFYGFLFFVFIVSVRGWRTRINLIFAGILLAASIGFSRLYLGVHYLSDILAGYLVGSLGLLFGIALSYMGWSRFQQFLLRASAMKKRLTVASVLMTLLWGGFILGMNLRAPQFSLPVVTVPIVDQFNRAEQLFPDPASRYALSVAGVRQSPINLVIQAQPDELQNCMRAAGWYLADPIRWRHVFRAYYSVWFQHDDPNAPLSLWFWQDRPQSQQWSQPDAPGMVFNRYFLRVWSTDYKTQNGLQVFVASTGHERLPKWHVIPRADSGFDAARSRLINQLRKIGGITTEATLPLATRPQPFVSGFEYEGIRSILTLKSCRSLRPSR